MLSISFLVGPDLLPMLNKLFRKQESHFHGKEAKKQFNQVRTSTLCDLCSCYSVAKSCPALCNPMEFSLPGFPVLHHLLEFALIYIHWVGDAIYLILCHSPLLLPSIFPSIRVFSNKLALCIRWPKYWSFNFSISPSNEYSELISFRMDCLVLLAAQGTLNSLLQLHSSKASILRRSAFFLVQLLHPYMTTGKTIASTRWTFVGKVLSLCSRCSLNVSRSAGSLVAQIGSYEAFV